MVPSGSRLPAALLAAVASLPWRSVLTDVAFVVAWFAAASFVFAATGWPTWLYVLAVLGGALGYSLALDPRTASREA